MSILNESLTPTDGVLTVSWQVTSKSGKGIDVLWRESGNTGAYQAFRLAATATSVALTGLTDGTAYDVVVDYVSASATKTGTPTNPTPPPPPPSTKLSLGTPVVTVDGTTITVKVAASSGVLNVVLTGASDDKIAPDAVPSGGSAVFTFANNAAGLVPGSNTLNVTGFSVPAGNPSGGSFSSVSETVVVTGAAPPVVTSSKVRMSINNPGGWGPAVVSTAVDNGVTWARQETGSIGSFSSWANAGMNIFPVYDPSGTGGDGNMTGITPAAITSDMNTLAPQLQALGITELEFGNEVYITQSASAYAAQCVAAYKVLSAHGIKMICCATNSYYSKLHGGSGNWFADFEAGLNAAGGTMSMIGGWTLHPYCPDFGTDLTTVGSDGYGFPLLTSLRTVALEAGWPDISWYVTEFGYSDGLSDSAGLAALVMNVMIALKSMPWVTFFNWYAARDASSDPAPSNFGLISTSGGARSGLTTMKSMIASNPSEFTG